LLKNNPKDLLPFLETWIYYSQFYGNLSFNAYKARVCTHVVVVIDLRKNIIINILRTKHQHLQGKMKKSDIEGGYSISWSLHE